MAQLNRLLRLGFKATDIRDEDGEVEVICYVRDAAGWREVVLVYSETEARAYRVPLEAAETNPLYMDAAEVEALIPINDVVQVVHALLSLPAPAEPRHALRGRTPDARPWTPRPSSP